MTISPSEFAQGVASHGGWYVVAIIVPPLIATIVAQFFIGKREREDREAERIKERDAIRKLWLERDAQAKQERAEWDKTELQLMQKVQDAMNAHLETLRAGPQVEHLTKLANLLLENPRRKGSRNDDSESEG